MRPLPPLLLVLMLLLAACSYSTSASEATPSSIPGDLVVTLHRTECFNRTCPVYNLEIRGDGTVIYKGIQDVAVMGEQTQTISQEQVRTLVGAFEQTQFFDMRDEYINIDITDHHYATITFQSVERSKKVRLYYGDESAPQILRDLASSIDATVNVDQWVKPTSRQ